MNLKTWQKKALGLLPVHDPGVIRGLEAIDRLDDGSEFWETQRQQFLKFGKERDKSIIYTGRIIKGQGFEKTGEIENAIREYEAGVADIENNVNSLTFPHYRLMVIYRRRGEYENEIRIIKEVLRVPRVNVEECQKRLKKALALRDRARH